MTTAEIDAKNKAAKIEYNMLAWANFGLLFAALIFAIFAVGNVFKANWPYAAGFAILHMLCMFIFRKIPWPETEWEKLARQLGIPRSR